jgi:hypothetical protein
MVLLTHEFTDYLMKKSATESFSEARKLLADLIIPRRITGEVVDKYFRKAIRVGVWRRFSSERRALLYLSRFLGVIKSPVLRSILIEIFLEIELYTIRGRALFYGILVSLRSHLYRLREILRDVSKLLVIGLSYLHNPPMYRVYG